MISRTMKKARLPMQLPRVPVSSALRKLARLLHRRVHQQGSVFYAVCGTGFGGAVNGSFRSTWPTVRD